MTALTCPTPVMHYDQIVMGHGSGGQMTDDLIQHIFAPAFSMTENLGDAAVLDLGDRGRLVFSTDSFVVQPLVFPGGNIGSLAVAGTVNDLAMMGAKPLYLSVGFILEEGLALETLQQIVEAMAQTARDAGVRIVAGDTKVVEQGHGDGVYINTSGVGILSQMEGPSANRAKTGDALIINGTLGDHGMAIMGVRNGLDFGDGLVSDAAALNGLVAQMLNTCPNIHVLRDLTRGGLAAAANEIAHDSGVTLEISEDLVRVKETVRGACEILGFDVLQVANEGKLLAIVDPSDADAVLEAMRAHPLGKEAVCIGWVVDGAKGVVIGKTGYGSTRVIDMPVGALLPRIC
jgi:hydrogenase expression/formation protein HypE